jgi:hypothetical protein
MLQGVGSSRGGPRHDHAEIKEAEALHDGGPCGLAEGWKRTPYREDQSHFPLVPLLFMAAILSEA